MKLESLVFRNIKAYGNNFQEIKFEEGGSLNIVVGDNGFGKCVGPDTRLEIEFGNPKIEKEFQEFRENEYVLK